MGERCAECEFSACCEPNCLYCDLPCSQRDEALELYIESRREEFRSEWFEYMDDRGEWS